MNNSRTKVIFLLTLSFYIQEIFKSRISNSGKEYTITPTGKVMFGGKSRKSDLFDHDTITCNACRWYAMEFEERILSCIERNRGCDALCLFCVGYGFECVCWLPRGNCSAHPSDLTFGGPRCPHLCPHLCLHICPHLCPPTRLLGPPFQRISWRTNTPPFVS